MNEEKIEKACSFCVSHFENGKRIKTCPICIEKLVIRDCPICGGQPIRSMFGMSAKISCTNWRKSMGENQCKFSSEIYNQKDLGNGFTYDPMLKAIIDWNNKCFSYIEMELGLV